MSNSKSIKPKIRLSFQNANEHQHAEFGFGVYQLLKLTDEYGSLNAASKEMHMAYSKAWKLINGIEEALSTKLVIKNRPLGTTLTPECKALLEAYDAISFETQKLAEQIFNENYTN